MSLAFSLEGKVRRDRPDGDLSGQGCVEERRDPMADFACKEAISDPAHQKEEAPHGGMQGFSGSLFGEQ